MSRCLSRTPRPARRWATSARSGCWWPAHRPKSRAWRSWMWRPRSAPSPRRCRDSTWRGCASFPSRCSMPRRHRSPMPCSRSRTSSTLPATGRRPPAATISTASRTSRRSVSSWPGRAPGTSSISCLPRTWDASSARPARGWPCWARATRGSGTRAIPGTMWRARWPGPRFRPSSPCSTLSRSRRPRHSAGHSIPRWGWGCRWTRRYGAAAWRCCALPAAAPIRSPPSSGACRCSTAASPTARSSPSAWPRLPNPPKCSARFSPRP